METIDIKLNRDDRVILWNLVCNEFDRLIHENDCFDIYLEGRLQQLKKLEKLLIKGDI